MLFVCSLMSQGSADAASPALFCLIEYATRKEAEKCIESCKDKAIGFAFLDFDD